MYHEMKEEITSKKTIQNQKNNVTAKDKITSFFILLILNRFLLAELFPLFFLFFIKY